MHRLKKNNNNKNKKTNPNPNLFGLKFLNNMLFFSTLIKACPLTLMDKQAQIHVSTMTLSKNFSGRKLGVRVVGLSVWVYKSLSDSERLPEVLFI